MTNTNALEYSKNEARTKGIAAVTVGNSKVRVEFADGKFDKKFPKDALPDVPTFGSGEEAEDFFVVINADKTEIESIGPVQGIFRARCVDFSRPDGEDSDPAPYEKSGSDGKKEWSYMAFNAFFQITKDRFKGVRIPKFFHYKFKDNGKSYAKWDGSLESKNAKWLPVLVEFCEVMEIVNEPIEWPDDGNVLPELLRRLLANKKEVDIVVKNG